MIETFTFHHPFLLFIIYFFADMGPVLENIPDRPRMIRSLFLKNTGIPNAESPAISVASMRAHFMPLGKLNVTVFSRMASYPTY